LEKEREGGRRVGGLREGRGREKECVRE